MTEQHTNPEPVVVREGASLRTADELARLLISDIADVLGKSEASLLSPWGEDVLAAVDAAFAEYQPNGIYWLGDEGLSSELSSLADQVEAASGLCVVHNDGYVIYPAGTDPDSIEWY